MPEIIAMNAVNNNFKGVPVFDAIICDPPYGIRASSINGLNKSSIIN